MSLKNKLKTTKTPFLKGYAFLSGVSKKLKNRLNQENQKKNNQKNQTEKNNRLKFWKNWLVWFRFYKQKTKKTELNWTKIEKTGKKPSQNRKKLRKPSQTGLNRFLP